MVDPTPGRKSWVEDKMPSSGLSDVPPGTLKASGDTASVPTQITPPPPSTDEATAMTTENGFTTEERNELCHIEANLQNMGTNLSGFGAFISNLNNKH